jgi:hypothetical protein
VIVHSLGDGQSLGGTRRLDSVRLNPLAVAVRVAHRNLLCDRFRSTTGSVGFRQRREDLSLDYRYIFTD